MRKLLLTAPLLVLFSCGGGDGEGLPTSSSGVNLGGEYTLHSQGMACANCHSFSGGTVFTNLHAQDKDVNSAAAGYRVWLLFQDGSSYLTRYSEKGVGNFILPKGNLKDWFVAVVVDANNKEVNRSLLHSPDRYNCNACHTQQGSGGAPGRIVNYNYYGGK